MLAAVLAALTLLPAVLGFVGERVLGRRGRAARDAEADTGSMPLGERWARWLVRFRIPVLVAVVLALLVCALPVRDLRLGMPNDSSAPTASTQHRAYDQIAKAFGPGVNGPLAVAVDLRGASDPQGGRGGHPEGCERPCGTSSTSRRPPSTRPATPPSST